MFEFEYYECLVSEEYDVDVDFAEELGQGWTHIGTKKAKEFGIKNAGENDFVYFFSRIKK